MSVSDPADKHERRPANLIDRLRGLFGITHGTVREDIEEALDEQEDAASFSPQERAMLRNVLNLHELRVEDVMVPRADIIAVSEELTLGEVLKVFQTAGHSRLPVHGGTLDDARGMVHIRDFVALLAASSLPAAGDAEGAAAPAATPDPAGLGEALWRQTLKAAGLVRTVLFVPPSMQALDLLVRMQAYRTHMALVIDEYGGTDGLVSIEDVVEMIVGDIEDEHDENEAVQIVGEPDGSFLVDARASLEEVSKAVGVDLSADEEAEVETLGGLVGALAGHVPGRGEIIKASDSITFEILDADPRRVKRVRIMRTTPPTEAEGADGTSSG